MNRTKLCFICLAFRLLVPAQAQLVQYTSDASGNLAQRGATVGGVPQIVGQPQLQIVVPGDYGSFSVLLADSGGCAYQWCLFGTNLLGQTSDSLLVLNVTTNSQGPYTVVVTNSSGSVTSSVAQLYIDSNRNGLPDSWELTYFGNLSQNATGDFDGDGISNLQEFFDGTNPTNKTSFRSRLTVLGDGGLVSVTPEQVSYAPTDTVSLTGTAFSPNSFFGWTGDLVTRSNPASLAMTTNKTVRACFTCQPAVAGLVGWWRGETDASDFVGDHNGTFYAGTNTILAPSITSTGMVGSAFVLYGTNYIQVPDTNDLRPPQFTIEAWVYPNNQSASYQTIVAKGSAVNDDDTYYLGVVNGGASFWTKTSGSMIQLAGGSVPPNQWTHLAATFDGSTKNLYVNGILAGTQGGLGPLTYDPQIIPVTIGSDWVAHTPAALFNGLLDEVSLFNRPLSATEINGLFIANVAGKCTTRPVFTSSPQFADATQGTGYTQQVATVLGSLPIGFSLSAGSLPAGLTISSSGQVSGVPTTSGSNTFAILATDAAGLSTELICGLRVLPVVLPVAVMPPGVVSWWRAENNALDAIGTNNGTLSNGVAFAAGEVGQAFLFNNTNQEVKVFASPSLNVGAGNGLSIEMWIKPTDLVNPRPLAEWNDGVNYGTHFWINVAPGGSGSLFANLRDTNLAEHSFSSAGGLLSSNAWQHVALTYDRTSGTAQIFLNGAVVASVNLGFFVPRTTVDLHLGYRPAPGSTSYQGLLDEPALYNRVLTAAEVAALYNAGPLGKASAGPYINTPPQLPDAVINQTYTQTIVAVRGTAPTTFSVVGGALAPGLGLSSTGVLNGTPTNAGAFSFAIRAADSASLAVTQQFSVQVYAPVPPPPGLVSWWRAETNAFDSSGTNNGVLRNGASFTAGKVGQAFTLDGISQSVDIADAPALHPASVTLETWALFTAAGTRILLGKPVGSGTLDSYQIYISGGTLGAYVSDAASGGPAVSIPFSPAFGSWYHFAYTFDDASKQQALYLNGSQVANGIVNKTIGYDNQPVLLGRDIENGSPNFFFAGRLDEAAIYNRALGSNEVASLFNAGPAGKTAAGPAFATPPVLPVAVVSQSYTQTLALARGTAQSFAVVGGALPAGIALSSAGVLSGVPVGAGTFSFVVRVTDSAALTADQPFTLQVWPKVSPPAGLVGWWRAENNTLDSVGGNNGFLVNNATFAPGKVGQSFALSGVNDAVEIEDSPALRPASVTVESWVMFFSPNGVQSIIAKTVGGGIGDSYGLWLENGNLRGMVSDITGANSPISVPFSPVVGQWYHVAFTFDDTTKQQFLYLNGAAVAFGIANLTIGYDPHPLFLGADDENGNMALFLQGRIDEAALYNRALSATEIASIYSADAAGKTVAGPYITTPPALPDAAYGVGYTQTVTSVRGAPNVAYALAGGALPGGLSLNPQGLLSGTPTNAGSFSFTVRATDAVGLFGNQIFSLRVAAPVPPAAGLVSWWRAENNALDAIGTNSGVALNGTTYAPGKVGQAFSLDGINDCIQIPDSPGLRPASLTLETWVMFNANTGIRVIFAKPLGGGTLDSFALWLENGNLKAVISDPAGNGPVLVSPFSPVVGQWYHLAYTFNDLTRQQALYLNNVTVASGLSDRSISYDTQPVLLGCDSDNGNHAWFVPGLIDEAAIYNRALSALEIAALYYAGVAGKSTVGPYFTTLPSLPDAIVNQPYGQTIISTRGTPPVSYTLSSGGLPPILTFSSSGLLSGTPANAGSFAFVARATDAAGLAADQFYTLNVFAPAPVPPGLLAWWRAENNALDSAGTNNGTLINGATFAAGKVGSAFSLNGTSAFVAVSNSAWFNPAGAFSVELWIKASLQQFSPDGLWLFVDKSHGFADGTGWGMEGNTDGTASFFFGKGGSSSPANFVNATTFSSVRDDHWHHLAGVFTGTQLAIYLDGVIQNNLSVTNIPAGNGRDVEIGRAWGGGNPLRYFHGLLDEISYYNRALSASEVASIYSAGLAGKHLPSGLILSASLQGNAVSLSFPSAIGVAYAVQSETSLVFSSWSVLSNLTALDTNVTVTFPVTGSPQRFYRVMTTGN